MTRPAHFAPGLKAIVLRREFAPQVGMATALKGAQRSEPLAGVGVA